MRITFGRTAASAFTVALLSLSGCDASTTVLTSSNPSRAPAAMWSDYATLPVAVRGVVPGHSKAELVALFPGYHATQYAALGNLPLAQDRRMVLYVNPAEELSKGGLCNGASGFTRGAQQGDSAFVVGALCDGPKVITRASATILTKDQTGADLAYNFHIIRDQLYQSLFPGANDPNKYYEGY